VLTDLQLRKHSNKPGNSFRIVPKIIDLITVKKYVKYVQVLLQFYVRKYVHFGALNMIFFEKVDKAFKWVYTKRHFFKNMF